MFAFAFDILSSLVYIVLYYNLHNYFHIRLGMGNQFSHVGERLLAPGFGDL